MLSTGENVLTLISVLAVTGLAFWLQRKERLKAVQEISNRPPLTDAEIFHEFGLTPDTEVVEVIHALGRLLGVEGRKLRRHDRFNCFRSLGESPEEFIEIFLVNHNVNDINSMNSVQNFVAVIVTGELQEKWVEYVRDVVNDDRARPHKGCKSRAIV